MTRKFWLKLGKAPQIHVRRALDNRIVFCANCEANRTLGVSSSGNLSCSSCGSENWMYLSAPIIANFKEYDERKVQERIAVDKYIQFSEPQLEQDKFPEECTAKVRLASQFAQNTMRLSSARLT